MDRGLVCHRSRIGLLLVLSQYPFFPSFACGHCEVHRWVNWTHRGSYFIYGCGLYDKTFCMYRRHIFYIVLIWIPLQQLCTMLLQWRPLDSKTMNAPCPVARQRKHIILNQAGVPCQDWFAEKDEAALWLDHKKTLQKGRCLRFGWLAISSDSDLLRISHITCTSSYPHVCTSLWSFRRLAPAQNTEGEKLVSCTCIFYCWKGIINEAGTPLLDRIPK